MPIEFSCPACHQLVRTPDSAAGKKGKCPQCQAVVQIPRKGSGFGVQGSGAGGQKSEIGGQKSEVRDRKSEVGTRKADQDRTAAAATIEFFCVECGQLVRTPAAAAGKKGKCPNCKAVVEIPKKGPGARDQWSEVRGQRSAGRRKEAEQPDLTPIEELTPMPSLTPPAPLLPPLIDEVFPSLAPLPAGSLESVRSDNPYASPFAAGHQPRRLVDEYVRRGLPWERDPSLDSFGETLRMVLSSPDYAFRIMRRQGGIGNPFGFLMLGQVLTSFLQVIVGFVLRFLYDIVFWAFGAQRLEIQWDALFLAFGFATCVAVTAGLLKGTIGGLLTAAMYHLFLMVTGGANGGFQATYRVVAFGSGSVYMLTAIPIIGPLFAMVMHFVVLTYGFKNAHDISGGRAFLALLPILLLLCCVGGLVLLNIPNMIEAIKDSYGH